MPKGRPKGIPKPPGSGRKPGSKNKYSAEIRDAVMVSFTRLGGPAYLESVGKANPAAYISLLAKILPHELATSGGGLRHEVLLRWMTPEMAKARGFIETPTPTETEEIASG
jgi:hypothetical protein